MNNASTLAPVNGSAAGTWVLGVPLVAVDAAAMEEVEVKVDEGWLAVAGLFPGSGDAEVPPLLSWMTTGKITAT